MRPEHLKQLEEFNQELNRLNERSKQNYTLLEWLGFFDISNLFELEQEQDDMNEQFENMNLNNDTVYIDVPEGEDKESEADDWNTETNEANLQPELDENLMDEEDDFENNERMLEGDYDIYSADFRAKYI